MSRQADPRKPPELRRLPSKLGQRSKPGEPEERPPTETDGYRILSYMLGGMLLYGGLGWLIGRWTGIPILFPIGMILGIASSIALIIFRVTRG